MLFRRELAPGAAEQVAVMEQDQRRRQIEQQLALHQVLRHAVPRSCRAELLMYHKEIAMITSWNQLCAWLTGVAPAAAATTAAANVFCTCANAAALTCARVILR